MVVSDPLIERGEEKLFIASGDGVEGLVEGGVVFGQNYADLLFGVCEPIAVFVDEVDPVEIVYSAVFVGVHHFHHFLQSHHAELSFLVFYLLYQEIVEIFL